MTTAITAALPEMLFPALLPAPGLAVIAVVASGAVLIAVLLGVRRDRRAARSRPAAPALVRPVPRSAPQHADAA
jgi:hypothetical protein